MSNKISRAIRNMISGAINDVLDERENKADLDALREARKDDDGSRTHNLVKANSLRVAPVRDFKPGDDLPFADGGKTFIHYGYDIAPGSPNFHTRHSVEAPPMVKVGEAAAYLGIGTETVREACRSGKVSADRNARGHYLIDARELDDGYLTTITPRQNYSPGNYPQAIRRAERTVDTKQAAELLGIAVSTVQDACKDGRVASAERAGNGQWRIPISELDGGALSKINPRKKRY